ncbi:MAG TPA: TetR/AcrR family transcriptional regulator [Gemmatimonadota bacterium]|nr:TetR/AcrR family transcriptional regulator [Gemmatimonadota bacterium]
MPKVTEAHLDARRRQILTAAHRCFAWRGFHEATMQEIADEAGLSAGALYRYFDGKEALIETLAAWGREQKREALEALGKGGGARVLGEVVAQILEALRSGDAAEAAVRLDVRLWGEALDQPAVRRILRDEIEALRGPIEAHVRRERRAGRIRRDADPEAVSHAVVALLVGLEFQLAFDPALDVAAYANTVRELLGRLAAPANADGTRGALVP